MSHFTVLVITKDGDYEKALEPFDESIEVLKYISRTKEDLIKECKDTKERYLNSTNENHKSWYENSGWSKIDFTNDDTIIKSYLEQFGNYDAYDKDGNEWSTYNPNSKWDWYSLGGRWWYSFKLNLNRLTEEERNKVTLINKYISLFNKVEELKLNNSSNQSLKGIKGILSTLENIIGSGEETEKLIGLMDILKAFKHTPNRCEVSTPVIEETKKDSNVALASATTTTTTSSKITKYLTDEEIQEVSNLTSEIMKDYQDELKAASKIIQEKYPECDFGEPSWYYSGSYIPMLGTCDSAQVKDIDFSRDEKAAEEAKRFWEVNIEGDSLREDEDAIDFKTAYVKEYYIKTYKDKETYIDERSNPMASYALLYHGEWIEPGEMGWFGCSSATCDGYTEYRNRFKEIMSNLDPDDYLANIDCHI